MGFGRSAIAILKANAALRKGNKKAFMKTMQTEDIKYQKLSKLENNKIRQEKVDALLKSQTQRRVLAVLLIGPLVGIFYLIWLLIEYTLF